MFVYQMSDYKTHGASGLYFRYKIMSCRKTNSCTRHKELKPVTIDIQKTSHSYIINQVQIENGKKLLSEYVLGLCCLTPLSTIFQL